MEVVDDFASIEDFEGFVYKTESNLEDESQQNVNQAEHEMQFGIDEMDQESMIMDQGAIKIENFPNDVDPLNTSIDIVKHEIGEDDQIDFGEDNQVDMSMEDMEKCDFCDAYFLKGNNELVTHFNEVHAAEFRKETSISKNGTTTKPLKPNLTYSQLITQALYNAPYHQLTFEGIRDSISQKYPYYQMSSNKWQATLSSHLACDQKFKKIEGSQLWTLDLSVVQSKDEPLFEPSNEQFGKEKHYEGPKKSKAIVVESTATTLKDKVKCGLCAEYFDDMIQLRDHVSSKHKDFVEKFTKKTVLQGKGGPAGLKILHKCRFCNNLFETTTDLSKHVEEKHAVNSSKPVLIPIPVQKPKVIAVKSSPKSIEPFEPKEIIYECNYCDQTFTKPELLNHITTFHGLEKTQVRAPEFSQCPHCFKRFNKIANNKQHIKLVHEKVKENASCDYCKCRYTLLKDLKKHTKEKHNYILPNKKCEFCEESFVQSAHLRQHEDRHSGIKKFKCDFCSDMFYELPYLETHTNKEHPSTKDLSSSKCNYCEEKFSQTAFIRSHLKNVHNVYTFKQGGKNIFYSASILN